MPTIPNMSPDATERQGAEGSEVTTRGRRPSPVSSFAPGRASSPESFDFIIPRMRTAMASHHPCTSMLPGAGNNTKNHRDTGNNFKQTCLNLDHCSLVGTRHRICLGHHGGAVMLHFSLFLVICVVSFDLQQLRLLQNKFYIKFKDIVDCGSPSIRHMCESTNFATLCLAQR